MNDLMRRLVIILAVVLFALGVGWFYSSYTPIYPFLGVIAGLGLMMGLVENYPSDTFGDVTYTCILLGITLGLFFSFVEEPGSPPFASATFLNTLAFFGGFGITAIMGRFLRGDETDV
jgi:uncharacterized membrane protein YccC